MPGNRELMEYIDAVRQQLPSVDHDHRRQMVAQLAFQIEQADVAVIRDLSDVLRGIDDRNNEAIRLLGEIADRIGRGPRPVELRHTGPVPLAQNVTM